MGMYGENFVNFCRLVFDGQAFEKIMIISAPPGNALFRNTMLINVLEN